MPTFSGTLIENKKPRFSGNRQEGVDFSKANTKDLVDMVDAGVLDPELEKTVFDEVSKRELSTPPPQQPVDQGPLQAMADMVTGRGRDTRATEELPSLFDTGVSKFLGPNASVAQKAKASLGMITTFDPQAQMDILKNSTTDQVTFQHDEAGNIIAIRQDETGDRFAVVLNKPGLDLQDSATFTGQAAAFTPGGVAAGGFRNLGTKAVVGGTLAASTDIGLQAGAQAAGSEQDVSPLQTGIAGVAGAIAEPVAAVGSTLLRNQAPRAARRITGLSDQETSAALPRIREAQRLEQATGKPLLKGQQTLDPFQLEEQSIFAQLPENTQKSFKVLQNQNKDAADIVQTFMSDLAGPDAVVTGARSVRDTAKAAVEAKVLARKEATSPLYKKAFEENPDIDLDPVISLIDEELSRAAEGGVKFKILNKFKKAIDEATPEQLIATENQAIQGINPQKQVPSLAKLHDIKTGIIDPEIASLVAKDPASAKIAERLALQLQKTLVKQIEDASPAYASARQEFIRQSGPVDEILDSIVGKVSNIPDDRLKTVGNILFDPQETNPQVVKQAERIIKSVEGGEDAWNQILRSHVEKRLGSLKISLDDISTPFSDVNNVPATILQALGNQKAQNNFKVGLSQEQRKSFDTMVSWLRRAAKGRPGGSQTGIRSEILERRLGGGMIRGFLRAFKQPVESVAGLGEDAARSSKIKAIGEIIFDPDFSARFNKAVKMKGVEQEKTAFDIFSQAMKKTLATELERSQTRAEAIAATRTQQDNSGL